MISLLILIPFPFISLLISLFEFSNFDNKTKSMSINLFSSCFSFIETKGKLLPKELSAKVVLES